MGPTSVEGFLNFSASKPQGLGSQTALQNNSSDDVSFKDSLAAAVAGGEIKGLSNSAEKPIELQLKELGFDETMIASLISLFEQLEEQIEQLDSEQLEWLAQSLIGLESGEFGSLANFQDLEALEDGKQTQNLWQSLVLRLAEDSSSKQDDKQKASSPLDQLIQLIKAYVSEEQNGKNQNQKSDSQHEIHFHKAQNGLDPTQLDSNKPQLANHELTVHAAQKLASNTQVKVQEAGKVSETHSLEVKVENHEHKQVQLVESQGPSELQPKQEKTDLDLTKATIESSTEKTESQDSKSNLITGQTQQTESKTVLDRIAAIVRKVVINKLSEEGEQKIQEGSKIHNALEKLVQEKPTDSVVKINNTLPHEKLNLASALANSKNANPSNNASLKINQSKQAPELNEYQLLQEEVEVQESRPKARVLQKVSLAYGLPQQTPVKIQTSTISQEFELPNLDLKVSEKGEERTNLETANLKPSEISADKSTVETQSNQNQSTVEDPKTIVKNRYGQELVEKFLLSTKESLKLWVSKKLVGMQIQIDPPDLGKIQLRTAIENGKIGVSIVAETSSAKELLSAHVNDMKEILKGQGLDVTNINIDIDNKDLSNKSAFDQNNSGSPKSQFKSLLEGPETESEENNSTPSLNYFDRVA